MESGMKCIKFLMFIFNLLFALSGLVILIVGAVIQAAYKEYLEFVPHEIFSAPVILIVVGVTIFVIAFFGCCGAMKEINCMVLTFAVLLGIIFILEISAGIAAYVLRGEVEAQIETRMQESLIKYDAHNQNIVSQSWDVMQHELHCCGVNKASDWKNASSLQNEYPLSCCQNLGPNDKCNENNGDVYQKGCLGELTAVVKNNVSIIGGIGIGIAFIQLIGIVFACCLSKSIRRDYETV